MLRHTRSHTCTKVYLHEMAKIASKISLKSAQTLPDIKDDLNCVISSRENAHLFACHFIAITIKVDLVFILEHILHMFLHFCLPRIINKCEISDLDC